MDLLKSFHGIYVLFTEPACDVHIPESFPLPYPLLGVWVMYEIQQGNIKDLRGLVWFLTELIILTRIELLAMALIVPFIIGKYKTWCPTGEYIFALMTFGLRVGIITLDLGKQLRNLSSECIYIVEATVNPEGELLKFPPKFPPKYPPKYPRK